MAVSPEPSPDEFRQFVNSDECVRDPIGSSLNPDRWEGRCTSCGSDARWHLAGEDGIAYCVPCAAFQYAGLVCEARAGEPIWT